MSTTPDPTNDSLAIALAAMKEEWTEPYRRALDWSAGVRHDMDNHSAKYVDCLVPGCRLERELLAVGQVVTPATERGSAT